jgi:hypothetical protein
MSSKSCDLDRFAHTKNKMPLLMKQSAFRHDAQIYTNDGGKLSHMLRRESSQPTATEVEQQPTAPKTEPASLREVRSSEEEQGNSLGMGLA